MKTRTLSTILLLIISANSLAQETSKYSVGLGTGGSFTLARNDNKDLAKKKGVKFLSPVQPAFSAFFDIHINEKLRSGLEIGVDGFDHGYTATPINSFSGISSGDLTSTTYIRIYKAGLRLGYETYLLKNFSLSGTIVPTVAYYPTESYLNDTASINEYQHTNRSPITGKIQYIHYPAKQNSGLHFLAKANIMFSYFIGKRKQLAITISGSYQQGFTDFYTDYVNIRQFDPRTLTLIQNDVYSTAINGTSLQALVGIRYKFGS